jgi:hypothetical protein
MNTRIAGIPCTVKVELCRDDGDGVELVYAICDRHGYPADWLELKATDKDIQRIEQETIDDYL